MRNNFALDLKVARRQSGLSQEDVAHLLGADRSRVSKIERGRYQPSVEEIASLCLVYGKALTELCRSSGPVVEATLARRLATLPHRPTTSRGLKNRLETLNDLAARLEASAIGL